MKPRAAFADWPLVFLALALSVFGIAMVYSAGDVAPGVPNVARGAWIRQLVWFVVALVGAFLATRASVRLLEWATVPAYWFTLALLAVTLVFGSGAGTAASMKGWIRFGGFALQPAEIAKLTVVLMLARVLGQRREPALSLLDLWKPALVVGAPWLLIMAQPDLGTGIVFIGIFFGMLFWSGVSWQLLVLLASPAVSLILAFNTRLWGAWFFLLLVLVLWYKPYLVEGITLVVTNVVMGTVAPVLWEGLEPYQQRRLTVFLDPSVDARGAAYHVIQSQVAIGSGGLVGKGFLEGTQKRLAFLPAQHTDFIFSVVGEELGFIGVTAALILFALLFVRIVRVAQRATDTFSSLIAFGLLSSWFVHVSENVGMTLNLLPVTGIPLPFFSYGGSFLLASWLAVGILVRISAEGRGRPGALSI